MLLSKYSKIADCGVKGSICNRTMSYTSAKNMIKDAYNLQSIILSEYHIYKSVVMQFEYWEYYCGWWYCMLKLQANFFICIISYGVILGYKELGAVNGEFI